MHFEERNAKDNGGRGGVVERERGGKVNCAVAGVNARGMHMTVYGEIIMRNNAKFAYGMQASLRKNIAFIIIIFKTIRLIIFLAYSIDTVT